MWNTYCFTVKVGHDETEIIIGNWIYYKCYFPENFRRILSCVQLFFIKRKQKMTLDNASSVDPIDFIETRCPVGRETDEKPRCRLLVSLLIRFQLSSDRELLNATPLVSLDNLVTPIRQTWESCIIRAYKTSPGRRCNHGNFNFTSHRAIDR